ncbi:hypothetical protein BLNAU_5271 [Blattamonas nauphoetae]|uniref:Uncharacterized protein n=1 Tax=Blattamonas nauphoetae TaxID=2049346 RepID=A0ABQ9Y7S8_9EUKA|nr:hypothetical protein BLNAU_5271 [Blattamonas nauphoetae]
MSKLLDEITRILTFHSVSGRSLTNKSALNSALSTLSEYPDLSDKIWAKVANCLCLVESVKESFGTLVGTEAFEVFD